MSNTIHPCLTRCLGKGCPNRKTCLRYTDRDNPSVYGYHYDTHIDPDTGRCTSKSQGITSGARLPVNCILDPNSLNEMRIMVAALRRQADELEEIIIATAYRP